MGSIELNFSDSAEGVVRNIQDKISELPDRMTNLVDDLASVYEVLAKDEAPVDKGDLQGSIWTENTGVLSRLITPHVAHALPVHEGYDSFELNSPVNIDGNWVYIKTHPGFPGNPFMDRAESRGESYVESLSNKFLGWLSE